MGEISISLPQSVQMLLDRLGQHGFACCVVGGCVRDSLLGKTPSDWDIATSAQPEQVLRCFADFATIETGLKHGTVTVLVDHRPLEVTTFRIDGAYSDNRRPDDVTFTDDLHLDLVRRDFTINAMAYHPDTGLVDPFGGAKDLAAGRIVCVGDAAARFGEDALRILRGVRFAATLEFALDPATKQAMVDAAPLLRSIAAERVRAELDKALLGPGVGTAFAENLEVMAEVLPELAPCFGFAQHSRYHHLDVWSHILLAISKAPPDPLVRTALLFHDGGKPICFTRDEAGNGHFYNHGKTSMELAEGAMFRLRYDTDTCTRVQRLILYHDTPIEPTAPAVKRWLNRLGEEDFRRLLLVQRCDTLAHADWCILMGLELLDKLEGILAQVLREAQCFQLRDLAVNGRDLLDIGVPEGQEVGSILKTLLDRVLSDTLPNDREALLEAAKKLHEA